MGEEEKQEEEKEEVEEEEEEDETHNYNGIFCSNAADLYSLAKAIVFFPKYKEGEKEGEEEEEVEEEDKKKDEEEEVKEEVEVEVEEKEITTTMQASAVVQQSCTHGQGNCSFLSIE